MNTPKIAGLVALAESVERVAGEQVRMQVMEGCEAITGAKTAKCALWVKGAIERLDQLVDGPGRAEILLNCGYQCAARVRIAEKYRKQRRKFPSLEAFLADMQMHPSAGSRLERAGDIIFQYYTPGALARPVRCYCHLLRKLPEGVTVSSTFCQCSQGFVEKVWEAVLGRPVTVEVVESCAAGARECKFAIHLSTQL